MLTILNTCVEYVHRLSSASPLLQARRGFVPFSPADTRMELLSRASILLLEPIPESRFTRTFHELYRLQKRAVPCIREGEAASESLATLTDEGLRGG